MTSDIDEVGLATRFKPGKSGNREQGSSRPMVYNQHPAKLQERRVIGVGPPV